MVDKISKDTNAKMAFEAACKIRVRRTRTPQDCW